MMLFIELFIIINAFSTVISTSWTREIACPISCLCHEEHFVDLAIARFIQTSYHEDSLSTDYQVSNDVLYDDDLKYDHDNPLLRVAICSLQDEIAEKAFIESLPKDLQVLSIIKSSESGNKTFLTSYFDYFDELVVLELQGSEPVNQTATDDEFILEIDSPIVSLKYFNFDKVRIKNSKLHQVKLAIEEIEEEVEIKLESVTMVQKKVPDAEILPYYKYKEIQKDLESPLFVEFSSLVLVRIFECNLQEISWEMFDGLRNLRFLILEMNNLKFIPSFAFYGTPNLYKLSLAWNNLLNIQITDLAGLLELEYLDLSHNSFSQLSELSFPPFPKLKVADFRDNPITAVFPNTFDIMNTTDSIILGGEETLLQLLPNSFSGLNKLIKLTLNNVDVPVLKQELLNGMPLLKELVMTGNINKIEFDAFVEVSQLEKLIMSNCNLFNLSMDAFYGLNNLLVLDLSRNHLKSLPPNVFDDQIQLKELLVHGNELTELPKHIFDKIPAKLIRLNGNPWHCSCALSDWDPMVINKIKQKVFTSCDARYDKNVGCTYTKTYAYIYDNRVAPKCHTPNKLQNISVFQAIRRQLRCKDHKLKLKKVKLVNQTDGPNILNTKVIKNISNEQEIPDIVKYNKDVNNDFNLKNIKIQNNNDPNDLMVNFHKMLNIPQQEWSSSQVNNDDFGTNKAVYNKKKKQNLQMLSKYKKYKKDRNNNFSSLHKEM